MNVIEPIVYFKSAEKMDDLDDNSIQLIITSPPYGKIKDYGDLNQIGFFDSFDSYFTRLTRVWKECYRVLEPKCRIVINIGDQYLRATDFGRYRILSIASQIINECINIGFDYLGDIIWQKVSTTNTTGGCSFMGSLFYPRNGFLTYDYEHILIFKKHRGKSEREIELINKELSKISLTEWKKWFIGHWKIPGVIQKEHIAMFPEEIPYRIIRMFSYIGDSVLDPFVGSGTTIKVAKSLLRRGIGYEINQSYHDTIEAKLNEAFFGYFKDYQFLLITLFRKTQIQDYQMNLKAQKQKSIVILSNKAYGDVIVDYLLIDEENVNQNGILSELLTKFEENTIQNYLRETPKWGHFKNYVIVINSKVPDFEEYKNLIAKTLSSQKFAKLVTIFYFFNVISEDFNLREFYP